MWGPGNKEGGHTLTLPQSWHSPAPGGPLPTCSILPICQVWGDDDPPLLSNADTLQALVHARDDVALPDVGVVGVVTGVTAARTAASGHRSL